MSIANNQTAQNEIVLSERVVTNDYRVVRIEEDVRQRFVRVEVEIGPFIEETFPDGRVNVRGSGRRGFVIWENDAYDAVRDTWRNEDLLAELATKF